MQGGGEGGECNVIHQESRGTVAKLFSEKIQQDKIISKLQMWN